MKIKIILLFLAAIFTIIPTCSAATWTHHKKIKVYIPQDDPKTKTAKNAFAEWSRKTNNAFVFYYVPYKKQSHIDIQFVDKPKDCNDTRAMACTKYTFSGNRLIHATIIMAKLSNDKVPHKFSRDEYYTAFLHEIGHAIGLEHTDNKLSIMYPYNDDNQEIQQSDINTLKKMYKMK